MDLADTIIAVSSPAISPGGGGIRGIIRLSGPEAWKLAGTVATLPEGAGAGYHGSVALPLLSSALQLAGVLLFKGPRSFTGEDVAELHVPGSPALLRACVDAVLLHGRGDARLATAGEFSARAFFNGKMDLTEAEGIAATINATTVLELRAAASLREGALHKEIDRITTKIADALALVEASIDFSDEEGMSFIALEEMESTLEQLGERIDEVLASGLRIDRLDAPPTVALIGKPNVGKSSLLNALAGCERSIISPIAGTTRDILAATLHTKTGAVRLLDVPGDEIPSDELRVKMMEARRLALLDADLIILVVDPTRPHSRECEDWSELPSNRITIENKADLLPSGDAGEGEWLPGTGKPWGRVSALTGYNIPKLASVISRLTERLVPVSQGSIVLNQRHRVILQDAKLAIRQAAGYTRDREAFSRHPELLSADLRRALDWLGQITGAISPDEVLGRIFSRFCIGK